MNPFKLEPHPYSQILPSAAFDDYVTLLGSVKKLKKLRYPVIIYQGKILDGNQRIKACREARIEPKWIEFTGTDAEALDLVWDLNFARRQLTPSQKAVAVAKATMEFERGRPEKIVPGDHLTEKLAEKAGVGMSSVKRAKKVLREGTNEEIKALETGEAKAKPLAEAIKKRRDAARDHGANGAIDDSGVEIPKGALPYWNRKSEARNVLNQISAARGQVEKLAPDDPMWSAVNLNGVIADLNGAYNRFKAAIPAHVCPYCKGVKVDGCKCCKGKGVVSKFTWSTIPEEIRKKNNQPF